MQARIYPIDWREEFGQLAPYMRGKGGVVRIRYAGQPAASSAFLGTLKSEYECKGDNRTWRSIRIDHQVYTVRYLSGIRDEFVRLMQIVLPKAEATEAPPGNLNVFTDVEAERIDADISGVALYNIVGGENPALMSRNRDRWVKALCDGLAEFLKVGHMMVVVNHGPPADQDEFWRYLWRGGLENLAGSGLVLVHMLDVSDKAGGIHDLAPAPQIEVNLPTFLSPHLCDDAVVDLTGIIVRAVPKIPEDEARRVAHTLVTTHVDDIPRLHTQYAAYLMNLRQEFG